MARQLRSLTRTPFIRSPGGQGAGSGMSCELFVHSGKRFLERAKRMSNGVASLTFDLLRSTISFRFLANAGIGYPHCRDSFWSGSPQK